MHSKTIQFGATTVHSKPITQITSEKRKSRKLQLFLLDLIKKKKNPKPDYDNMSTTVNSWHRLLVYYFTVFSNFSKQKITLAFVLFTHNLSSL